jgi:hypothetical protein
MRCVRKGSETAGQRIVPSVAVENKLYFRRLVQVGLLQGLVTGLAVQSIVVNVRGIGA